MQRTINATSLTKNVISQKQSVEIVQTMLHGALSLICYLRNFLPEYAFTSQAFVATDNIQPYEDYATGKLLPRGDVVDIPKTNLQTLIRGRSRRADAILTLLEEGIFSTLKDSSLRALQIYVHADPNNRSNIIEMYSFTIRYNSADLGKTPIGIGLDGSGTNVGLTTSALQQLLLQISMLCEKLPDLPEQRFLTMELVYSGSNISDLQSTDWVECNTESVRFAECKGWTEQIKAFKSLDSGFHSSGVTIRHLNHPTTSAAIEAGIPILMPDPQAYGEPRSKLNLLEISPGRDSTLATSPITLKDDEAGRSTLIHQSVSTQPDAKTTRLQYQPRDALGSQNEQQRERSHSQFRASQMYAQHDTQSSNMKAAFKAMMQAERLTQGDTQFRATQATVDRISSARGPLLNMQPHTSPKKSTPLKIATLDKPMLIPEKYEELKRHCAKAPSLSNGRRRQTKRKSRAEHFISCQCGFGEEEGDMVQCTFCNGWQHIHCYGFLDKNDTRLPEDHACYRCLLHDQNLEIMVKLVSLVQKRRAIYLIMQNEPMDEDEFRKQMGLTLRKADLIMDQIALQGYVHVAGKWDGQSTIPTEQRTLIMNDNEHRRKNMHDELFQPFRLLGQFYRLPIADDSQSARNLAHVTNFIEKPLPSSPPRSATYPTSRGHNTKSLLNTPSAAEGNEAAATPSLELDLQGFQTPFETPFHHSSQAGQDSKRPRLNNTIELQRFRQSSHTHVNSSPSRWRSLHNAMVFNVNGAASSPNPMLG